MKPSKLQEPTFNVTEQYLRQVTCKTLTSNIFKNLALAFSLFKPLCLIVEYEYMNFEGNVSKMSNYSIKKFCKRADNTKVRIRNVASIIPERFLKNGESSCEDSDNP